MDPSAHLVAESITRTESLIERQRTLVAQAHPSKRSCETKALDHLLKTLEGLRRYHQSLVSETKTSAPAVTDPRPRIPLRHRPALRGRGGNRKRLERPRQE
jgi:hypothetical protein